MKKVRVLLDLYQRPETVFSLKELSLMFPQIKYLNLKRRFNSFVSGGKLVNPVRGIYAKTVYNPLEFAGKLYSPSYISFETVLVREGVIFQKSTTVYVSSYLSRERVIGDLNICYRRLKREILLNRAGIERKIGYFSAVKERAFCDMVYVSKDYYFDSLSGMDWDLVFDFAKIYKSKRMLKRVESYYKLFKGENV